MVARNLALQAVAAPPPKFSMSMSSATAGHSVHLDGLEPGARVVVAMSGGVDSSVAAALLKRSGYDVIGVTLQLYDHGSATGRKGACCAGQDIHDARRVAGAVGIPHYVLDYEVRFRASVIEGFADSYAAGETPIPCVLCNQKVKFEGLLDTARDLGAKALATGHYIAMRTGANGPELYRAADAERDQSYFLFATTPRQLAFLRFPLGHLQKGVVRDLARQLALPVAEKPDSQDICFVPTGRYSDIVERLRPEAAEPGDIVHVDGRVLGRHAGILNFTIGQRRGLKLAVGDPLYVVRLDAERREVVVGSRSDLHTRLIMLKNVNWLGEGAIQDVAERGIDLHVRVRSSQKPQPATLSSKDGNMAVLLHEGEYGIAAGQACVFYADGSAHARVLGGGWIAAAHAGQSQSQSFSAPGPDAPSVVSAPSMSDRARHMPGFARGAK
jgi:tRNA-specific 2-thiouridylase